MNIKKGKLIMINQVAIIILMLISMLVTLLMVVMYLNNIGLREEVDSLNDELVYKEKMIQDRESRILELRKINHDNRKHINLLNSIDSKYVKRKNKISLIAESLEDLCKNNNIDYRYIISNENFIDIAYSDLNSILVNIVENAINSISSFGEYKNKHNYIRLNSYEDNIIFCIEIINNGPKIENTRGIFVEGFSSSGESGRGFGLTIVKELVEKYNGNIFVNSNEINTTFTIIFLK